MRLRTPTTLHVQVFTGGPFAENTVLVDMGDGVAVLIDPGAAAGEAVDAAEAAGLTIEAILLTHAHLDHVDGVAEARARTSAPIYLHPADRVLYDNASRQAAAYGFDMEQPPPPDFELVEGQSLTFGASTFDVRFAPGHAPGHVVFVARDEPVAIVGDVVFAGSIGRTDLPGGDYRVLMDSIRSQILTLPPETVLYPGHGPHTTAGHEARTNPFLIPLYGGEFA